MTQVTTPAPSPLTATPDKVDELLKTLDARIGDMPSKNAAAMIREMRAALKEAETLMQIIRRVNYGDLANKAPGEEINPVEDWMIRNFKITR